MTTRFTNVSFGRMFSCMEVVMNENETVTREEILNALANGAPLQLVEALDEPYFRAGHLPGAINMPLARVAEVAREALPDQKADVVVYCASKTCENSHVAARKLRALGYVRVRVYAGGKADWREAGLALETERAKVA
jgi:rhodanese-related sulfurtransferase